MHERKYSLRVRLLAVVVSTLIGAAIGGLIWLVAQTPARWGVITLGIGMGLWGVVQHLQERNNA